MSQVATSIDSSLQGNPLTHKPKYRQYVIYKLKTVRVLDYKRISLAVSYFSAKRAE
jgi:hypothetical protein